MARKHHRSKATKAIKSTKAAVTASPPSKSKVGLLVTDELEKAIQQCRSTVHRIAKDCKAKNKKYRDIEFDFDNDQNLCLAGLVSEEGFAPTAASRATDIYTKPQFFIDGAGSNDIVQGALGDCWFLSALSTASTSEHLIEKCCVARDEKVGVYGFVFFKNGSWVSVIIDDLLFVKVPKFEELSSAEQLLFHNDKKKYNKTARKGGKNLYFARSGTENETWVPLIEKAYAKLHGDYSSLSGGRAAEAIEDLTGGVSSMLRTKDILDTDRFWEEELLHANDDRLFGAGYGPLDTSRIGSDESIKVEGLIGGHAYSILKAIEVEGKRFLILRNPWGKSEWSGPWSDGSKEWTPEWLRRLPEIGHVFGEDGQFVMEYSDFLERFEDIDKTMLFDSSWKMSMEWLRVPVRPPPAAWSFGSVSFNFSIAKSTKALIVLSKLDERYFKGIDGCYAWNLQFLVYKIGDTDPELVAESEQAVWGSRSVNTEAELEPGEYVVHIRVDGLFKGDALDPSEFNKRKLARVLTQRALARSAASNYDPSSEKDHLPASIDALVGREKAIAGARAKAAAAATASSSSTPIVGDIPEDVAGASDDKELKTSRSDSDAGASGDEEEGSPKEKKKTEGEKKEKEKKAKKKYKTKEEENKQKDKIKEGEGSNQLNESAKVDSSDSSDTGNESDSNSEDDSDGNSDYTSTIDGVDGDSDLAPFDNDAAFESPELVDVFIGLRVYVQGGERVSIVGTIQEEADKLYAASLRDEPRPQ
ncbi:hypothetical protein D9756_002799 [Leucocoprinus leucothites]|uniref:Calpain catalytic domain-containing protein n=1 Tax=Leucocoprinus leucothites TaxID=201217 RepID=A0A8H5GCR3_9AGAR|nr:hypothetical protein D9756_002799 [Leucoagaricus leucothites]